jgi:hypothetical protein
VSKDYKNCAFKPVNPKYEAEFIPNYSVKHASSRCLDAVLTIGGQPATTLRESLLECDRRCTETASCSFYHYNTADQRCDLHASCSATGAAAADTVYEKKITTEDACDQ